MVPPSADGGGCWADESSMPVTRGIGILSTDMMPIGPFANVSVAILC